MRRFSAFLILPILAGFGGCATGVSDPGASAVANPVTATVTGATGTVFGGSQAIANASIQLWTVGTTANGSGAVGLLTTGSYTAAGVAGCVPSGSQVCYPTSVTTSTGGGFSLAGQFSCASAPNQLVYLTASGGNPGLAAGTNNAAIQLMTAVGSCANLVSGSHWPLNELTTVASVYSLSAYMGSSGSVGSTGANATNLAAAFAQVGNLVNLSAGYAQLVVDNGTELAPQAELGTLANILAACVNSTGSTTTGQPCATLFSAATGSISAANVLQAALNIANNPSDNVFSVASTSGPFQPTLSTAPTNWTVVLTPVTAATVTTGSLPSATVGYSYSQQLTASGGAGQYTWAITSGQSALAAAGINFSSSGQFYGTPGSSGSYPITVQVTDGPTGLTATANLTLTISPSGSSYGCGTVYAGSTINVSGTVTYTGTKTGRIYLVLLPTCGGGGGATGTSISSAGTFTIRGVPANTTFLLEAFMDTLGYGEPNTADPSGSLSVSVGTGSASGVSLALSDSAGVSPNSALSLSSVTPFNNGVVAFYNPAKYNGVEAATGYTLQWSTTSSFSSIAGSKTFPANGTHSNVWFVNGLANGSVYYFRAYATENGTSSGYSTLSSAVTIGAPAGTYTVSGSVSYPGTATGPLYVVYLNQTTGAAYAEYIANPVSAQAYSLQLPGGTYELAAVIDQNNDGVVDAGDLQNVLQSQGTQLVAISGTATGENVTLPGGNVLAQINTQHYVNTSGVTQDYYLNSTVQEALKQPVAVTLASGPNVTGPIDIALCGQSGSSCGVGFQILTNSQLNTPNVGDTYTYNVTYSDGTTGTVTAAVTAVLNGYAIGLSPTGTGGSTTPTFTWTDSSNASIYTYGFEIGVTNGSILWQVPEGDGNLTSATTSLVWGTDPTNSSNTPSVSTLTGGTNYSWSVDVYDQSGNQVITEATYTPSSSSSALTIQTGSLSGGAVSSPYAAYIAVAGGTTPYTAQVSSGSLPPGLSLATCTNCSGYFSLSGTPSQTGTYSFTVKVTDSENPVVSVSQAYSVTINSAGSGTLSQCTHDGSGNALLNGHYAFLLGGFDPNGHYYDQIGSFVANGSGTITSGMADVNGDNGLTDFANGEQSYTFSGTYSIGSTDDRGIMTVSNSNTSATGLPATSIYCFAADSISSGVANSGRIIEADGNGYLQTGVFAIQNTANFNAAALNSGYAFGVQGVDTPPNRRALVGQFTLNGSGGVSSGQFDFAAANNNGSSESYTAAAAILNTSSYTMGSGGRGTLTLNVNGNSLNFVTYEFGSNQFFMLSSNNSVNPLLLGQATPQTLTTFTTANVAGRGVIRSDGTPGAGEDDFQVGVLTYDGSGNATFVVDQNNAGVITTPTSIQTANYAVTSLGYLTLPGAGSHPVNFYLYAPGGGYGVSSSNQVDFWTMVPQTVPNGGFTSSSISGAYALGTVPSGAYYATNPSQNITYPTTDTGEVTFGVGTVTITDDTVQPPGTVNYVSVDQTSSTTWALDSTYGASYGRIIVNGGPIGYIVSPSQVFLMQESSGKYGSPQILDHQ